MKNKLLLLIGIVILLPLYTFAQIQKEKGKIILKGGEELQGSITFFYDSPEEIIYYDSTDSKSFYSPSNINEIKLANGKRLISLESEHPNDGTHVVLKLILATNKIDLLSSEGSKEILYASKNGKAYRLENNIVTLNDKGKEFKKLDYQYINVLSQLMSDRMDLVKDLNSVKLNTKELTALFLEYAEYNSTYYVKEQANQDSKSNYFSAFAQLNNHGGSFSNETNRISLGVQAGIQYNFWKGQKLAVKLAVDQSVHNFSDADFSILSFLSRFQYEFIQKSKYNAYINLPFVSFKNIQQNYHADWKEDKQFRSIGFDLNPGLGIQAKPTEKTSLFLEVNNLLHMRSIPKNFSVGLSYRLSNFDL